MADLAYMAYLAYHLATQSDGHHPALRLLLLRVQCHGFGCVLPFMFRFWYFILFLLLLGHDRVPKLFLLAKDRCKKNAGLR